MSPILEVDSEVVSAEWPLCTLPTFEALHCQPLTFFVMFNVHRLIGEKQVLD